MKQDQPKNLYVAVMRDRCERAALEGSWVSLSGQHMYSWRSLKGEKMRSLLPLQALSSAGRLNGLLAGMQTLLKAVRKILQLRHIVVAHEQLCGRAVLAFCPCVRPVTKKIAFAAAAVAAAAVYELWEQHAIDK